ncbi:MAG: hypothetical protein RDV48_04505 [Candidatus Eremiobacteraeota bacterium]|nr:hypothetical protein [Candidatus Eremiobacteraeota bacterium]
MDKIEAIERFVFLVKQIPDERVEKLIALLEDYMQEQGMVIIEPFDRSKARPEFLERLDAAKEGARRGELVSHDEVRKEIFGA